jgi:hypothetical protein
MRTIDFSQVLFNAIQFSGNDRHNIMPETFAQFRDFSSTRMREAWETFEWQDVCRLAEFTTVVVDGVRYFTPAPDADEILAVFDKNPLSTTRATQQTYTLYYDGTEKVVCSQEQGYYVYRIKCPELTGDLWDGGVSYSTGAQVYFDEGSGTGSYMPVEGKAHRGNFFNCTLSSNPGESPTTHPSKWAKVQVPYVFGSYMSWGSTANWLISEGMVQEAAVIEGKAKEALEFEYDKATRQQGQFNRLSMIRTY